MGTYASYAKSKPLLVFPFHAKGAIQNSVVGIRAEPYMV